MMIVSNGRKLKKKNNHRKLTLSKSPKFFFLVGQIFRNRRIRAAIFWGFVRFLEVHFLSEIIITGLEYVEV